jgi:hypothetical protein
LEHPFHGRLSRNNLAHLIRAAFLRELDILDEWFEDGASPTEQRVPRLEHS